jgi:hypothetical protein
MRALTFRRTSAAPPPESEWLEIAEDGSFTMWRSTGEAIGRFGGVIPDIDVSSADVDRALDAPVPVTGPLPMDASLERVEVAGLTLDVGAHIRLDGPWGDLVRHCRELMADLRSQPLATLVVDVDDPSNPRLVSQGLESLRLELIQPAAEASIWRDGVHVSSARGYANVIESVTTRPGWQLEIPIPDLETNAGDTVVVQVAFDAYDGELPIPVEVYAVAEIAAATARPSD